MKQQAREDSIEDQLRLSHTVIELVGSGETVKNLILKNVHQSMALAYKIKTNNLEALQATPNYGFIKANTAISLRIKTKSTPFDAKLLISYANAGEKPEGFNQLWTSLRKSDIRSKQVRVYRSSEQPEPTASSEATRSPLAPNPHSQRSQSLQKSSRQMGGSRAAIENVQSQLANNILELQQKLQNQQLANAKIKQQLEITDEKLKKINQERLQIKVNKSIGIICDEYHTSFTTLLLYGLAVFVCGYVLAQWEK